MLCEDFSQTRSLLYSVLPCITRVNTLFWAGRLLLTFSASSLHYSILKFQEKRNEMLKKEIDKRSLTSNFSFLPTTSNDSYFFVFCLFFFLLFFLFWSPRNYVNHLKDDCLRRRTDRLNIRRGRKWAFPIAHISFAAISRRSPTCAVSKKFQSKQSMDSCWETFLPAWR